VAGGRGWGVGWIAMHMRGEPATMASVAHYRDVVSEVRDHLVARAEEAAAGGVREVWIDPGIGFAKNSEHNLALLANLRTLVATGWPVVVGTSRKSFIGRLLVARRRRRPGDRLEGSLATAAWAMTQGAAMVRVHDVAPTVHAARLYGDGGRSAPEATSDTRLPPEPTSP